MEPTIQRIQTQKQHSKTAQVPKPLQELIESGIPLRKVVFAKTVIYEGSSATPEWALYDPEHSPKSIENRKAKIWYTPYGVVCLQRAVYKIIPLSNVIDTIV